MEDTTNQKENTASRRSFLRKGLVAGALSTALMTNGLPAFAKAGNNHLREGDAAILRFLAALEIIETDLWQQYNELGGIQDKEPPAGDVLGGSGNPPYTAALQNLDSDMPQYIHDNTDDEFSHFTFINAYLKSKDAQPVDLEQFRTLQGSQATGAMKDRKRITNLMQLTVDTSWWTRYRSDSQNPDIDHPQFPQAIEGLAGGQFPAIPRNDDDTAGSTTTKVTPHLQAIANTAAFHFGFIEQGGTSLYPSLAQRVTNSQVLRILLSIGPSETMHFQVWHDKAGNAVSTPLAPLTDPTNGLTFPDLNARKSELFQTNLIMPEPTIFLSRSFPMVSIIRPTETEGAAMGAVNALTADGLFRGQSQDFFDFLRKLAEEADQARRRS